MKKADVFVLCLVVLIAFSLFTLLHSFRRPSIPSISQSALKESLKQVEVDLQMQTAALVNALRTVEEKVDPGPRPAWYFHLYDYYSWTTKKEAYDTAQASLESCKSQIRDLAAKKVDLEEYIAHFHDNNKSPLKATWHFLLNSWNELARPVLHAFLFLSLLGLLIRIVFRYFLLKQQIGTVRL